MSALCENMDTGAINVTHGRTTSLLDLPPEIWSRICKLVIHCDKPVNLDLPSYPVHPSLAIRRTPAKQPPITRICRVIREDCLPHYYRATIFYFCDAFDRTDSVSKWLVGIGKANRAALRMVFFLSGTGHIYQFRRESLLDLLDDKARVRTLRAVEHRDFAEVMEKMWTKHKVNAIFRVEVEVG